VRVRIDVQQVNPLPSVDDIGRVGVEETETRIIDAVDVLQVDAPERASVSPPRPGARDGTSRTPAPPPSVPSPITHRWRSAMDEVTRPSDRHDLLP
jgi:hypothetical protein